MANYVIFYIGGRPPASPEEGAQQKERWAAWLGDLGDAVVNPGMPLGPRKSVTPEGVSDGGGLDMMGFSIVKADSMDDALAMAKKCPFLDMGTLEVAEAFSM